MRDDRMRPGSFGAGSGGSDRSGLSGLSDKSDGGDDGTGQYELEDGSGQYELEDPPDTPDASGVPEPTRTQRQPRSGSRWPNVITGSFITVALLFGLRYGAEYIRNDAVFIGLLVFVAVVFMGIQYLRRCLLTGVIMLTLVAGGVYVVRNWERVKSGKVTLKEAGQGMFEVATGFGPGKDLSRLIERTGANEKIRKLTEQMEQALQKRHPGLDLKTYLQRVDSRDPSVNTLASRLVESCDSKDRLCEATKILSFVTDRIKYRSDPLARPMEGDYPKPPKQTLEATAGDCEDKSILLLSLLGSIGIPGYMVFEEGHAHALVCFERPIDELMVERVKFRGWSALEYLEPVLGELSSENLKRRFDEMAPAYLIKDHYCYAAETTAEGSWFGLDENHVHLGVYDPFGVPAS